MIKKRLKTWLKLKLSGSKKLHSKKPNLVVGKHTLYNKNISISGSGKVIFGKYCAIGPNLTIISSNHDYNIPALQKTFYNKNFKTGYPADSIKGPIIIGNDVWFGQNVTVLSNVKIGNGACIGASSVITKDVPDYAIVAGVPAKIIKFRFNKKIITFLLKLKWWDWSNEKIKRNERFFITDLNKINSMDAIKKIIKN